MSSLFNPVLRLLGALLAACYSLTSSYGLAIALFTLVIMVVFTPLTMKSTRSMMAMQQIQPEMKALQAKYRDDRQTLNTEMMALYQSHGVNPLGGCLPMLVQIPVFFMLFALLRGLTRVNSADTEFDPKHLDENSQLFKDLTVAGKEMVSFGIDLSQQANDVVSESLVTSIPYVLMVVVTGLTSWLQQRQMAARRTPGQEVPQQQQMLMKILPWTLPVFAFFMPAALVVYFIVSNLWRVGQQSYISRRIHTPEGAARDLVIETEVADEPKSKPKASGGQKKPAKDKTPPAAPAGPRPRPRSRDRDGSSSEGAKSKDKQSGRSDKADKARGKRSKGGPAAKKPGPSRPAPTSRTAGHGPVRPANKKKKR